MKAWLLILISLFTPSLLLADSLTNDTVTVTIINTTNTNLDCSDITAVDADSGKKVAIADDLSGVENIPVGQSGEFKADVGGGLFTYPWRGYVTCKDLNGNKIADLQWTKEPGTQHSQYDTYQGSPDATNINVNPSTQTVDPADSNGDMHMTFTVSNQQQ